MAESRTHRGGALAVALVLLVSGCAGGGDDSGKDGGGSKGGDSAAAAAGAKAAKEYAGELTAWSTQLSRAVATRKVKYYKKRDVIWPDLSDVLEDEPTLAKVEGGDADPAYDAAQEVAERFGPVRAELVALQGADFDLARISTDFYGPYIDAYGDLFDISDQIGGPDRDIDELLDRSTAEVKRDGVALVGRYRTGMTKKVARLQKYRRQLTAVKVPGVLGRSVQAYALEELDGVLALHREFIDYLASTPPRQADVALYNTRVANAELAYDTVAVVPWRTRGAVTRALSAAATNLARQATAGKAEPTGPYVGDAYRAQLVKATAKRPRADLKVRAWITEQMWLLHRIRDVEKTPEDVYEQARGAVALQQTGEDPRDYYGRLLTVFSGSSPYYPQSEQERQFPTYKKWALEQLAGPAPELLEPSRKQFVSWLSKVPTTGPLFKRDAPWRDYQEFGKKILTRAAKMLDDAATRRPAVVRAVTATRPDLAAK